MTELFISFYKKSIKKLLRGIQQETPQGSCFNEIQITILSANNMLINCSLSYYRSRAPALCNLSEDTRIIPADIQGVLGPIPHTIRGFLHSYQSLAPTCAKFKQCIACSETVIDKYRKEGVEFVFKVLNSGSYLEEVTGLSELQLTAEMCDVSLFVVVYIM